MTPFTRRAALGLIAASAVAAGYAYRRSTAGERAAEALYATPLPKPDGALSVFHLGHSLVGRDMPAMLEQLAGAGHDHASQLGWGTSLREHWDPDLPINGFDQENDHPRFRSAQEALGTEDFDAVVLTEMVEIADAVRYHDSAATLAKWARLAHDANSNARVYLYETWHHTDDPAGWLARIDADLPGYWQGRILYPALARSGAAIHLIPAGQVMAAFVRRVTQDGGVPGLTDVDDLMAKRDDGTPDTIHFNDLGAYLVALTHYAVLYHRSPVGLPFALNRADGTPATPPSPEAAALMQSTVWDIVTRHPETGVAA